MKTDIILLPQALTLTPNPNLNPNTNPNFNPKTNANPYLDPNPNPWGLTGEKPNAKSLEPHNGDGYNGGYRTY